MDCAQSQPTSTSEERTKQQTVTLESLGFEVKINSTTNFEVLNARDTITAMNKHNTHNGIQLEAFRRLTVLSQEKEEAKELLSSKLGETIIPVIQRFYADHRLVALSACAIGNALRVVDQSEWNEDGIDKYWKQLVGTFVSILPYHLEKKEVQAYSFYLIGALLLRDRIAETIDYLNQKKFFTLMLHSYQRNYFDLWLWQNMVTCFHYLLNEKCFHLVENDPSFHSLGREILYTAHNSKIPDNFRPLIDDIKEKFKDAR